MSTSKYAARYGAARYASDPRHDSQLAFLQRACLLTMGGGVPSRSQLVRRAVGLLTDHVSDMIQAGRLDGRPMPHEQDTAAERLALRDFGRIADAPPPRAQVDARGRVLTWAEAVQS